MPDDAYFTFLPNTTESATIHLERGEIIVGRIEHRRLTLQEIVDAGIDIRDPDNQFVYTFRVQLVFREVPLPEFEFTTNGTGQVVSAPPIRIPIHNDDGSE